MKRKYICLVVIVIASAAMFVGCIDHKGPDEEIVNAVSQACSGKGVEQAAAYTGGLAHIRSC